MPQARSTTTAEGTFQCMAGGRLPCPERRLTVYDSKCVSRDDERETKRGSRLLPTFSAMTDVQRKRLPWDNVPNTPTLAAATLGFVCIPDGV